MTSKSDKSKYDRVIDSEFENQTDKEFEDGDAEQEEWNQFMIEIKIKFPELKPLNQKEIISVLNMYDNHLQIAYEISNPSYYEHLSLEGK